MCRHEVRLLNPLGRISIRGEDSVREARNKVRAVVEAGGGDPIVAARVATATSEVMRLYLLEGRDPELELRCDEDRGGTVLTLSFMDPEASPEVHHLEHFFDRIRRPRSADGVVQQDIVVRISEESLTSEQLPALRAVVQKKGRDELLSEIRSKNVELQESLDNLRRERSAKERMESELNIGREIQMSMLPLSFPAFPERRDFDVHAALHPAREVGGDFYDLFLIDDSHFCFCVGDVSGKGVPAALFMAVTKTLIKSRAANDLSPASILSHVNTELAHSNESCMFVTVFLAILDLRTGAMCYSNAGHNPPYLKRANGDLVRIDQRHGPIIGAAEGLAYREDHLTLDSNDLLFLYTDGVTEAMDPSGKLYSEARLHDLLAGWDFDSPEDAVRVGVEDVWRFQSHAEQADDVTVLSVSFAGRTAEVEWDRLELSISNRLEEIARVNEEINAFAEAKGLDVKTRRRLNVVFDELLNNTISYGYEDDAEHIIQLTIGLAEGRLHATIIDDGRPFNPFDSGSPDTELSIEERPIGGLGVHLVRNVMDRVSYERRGKTNVVLLDKNLESSEE